MANTACDLPSIRVRKRNSIQIFWERTSTFEKNALVILVCAVLVLNAFLYFMVIEIAEMVKGNHNKPWCNRFSIKKHLLVLFIIIISILIGGLLYWTIKLAMLPKFCTTSGCLLTAAQIVTYVDTTIDPCDDFYKFACGNYFSNNYGNAKTAPVIKLQEQVQNQVEEIIKEPIKDDDHYLVKTQKMIFRACMNETAVEEESLEIFKEILDELNGWPVVVGIHWNQSLFNWMDMIYKLRQKGYNHMMMLTIGPVINPTNSSQYIVRVEEPFIYIREKNIEHYKTYMTEVAVAFGAERSFAEREMEKVLDFMEKLKSIGKKNNWRFENDNDTEINVTAEVLATTFTVEEFQTINNEIDWLHFINKILYPSANISSDDYVIFPKTEFLEEYFSLLSKAPKRTQANYIIWSVLKNYIQFMPKELQQIRANYIFQTEGSFSPGDRFEFCKEETRGIDFSHPTDILFLRRYLTIEKQDKVRKLFHSVKLEFVSLLKEASWMDKQSRENALKKLDATREIIGAIGNYYEDEVFEEDRSNIKTEIQPDSFFKMNLNRAKEQIDARYSLIHNSIIRSKLSTHHNIIAIVNAIYFPDENTIFLPAGILQGMFYSENKPMYFNYGAIGSIMGHELTHGFCKAANEYEDDGSSKTWTDETAEAYEEAAKCVVENAEEFEIENFQNMINGTQTLEENIADYTGIKASYAAYKKWVQDNGEELQLPGIDYTPYQMFWISAVNLHCYQLETDEFQELLERDNHAFNVFRATSPLRNNPDFAKDFNCPLGSKMNPPDKCQVF